MPPVYHPSRREVLRWIGAGSALAATAGLAACAPSASSSAAPDQSAGGGGGDLGSTMTLATWPNYDDPKMLDQFAQETGVTVNVQVYGSTEEMEALLRAGNSGIDVAVPSQYAIPGWIEDKLIEPLDKSALGDPDFSAWNAMVTNQPFDPGNKYTFPKLWGTTGMLLLAPDRAGTHDVAGVLRHRVQPGPALPDRRPPDLLARLDRRCPRLQLQHPGPEGAR